MVATYQEGDYQFEKILNESKKIVDEHRKKYLAEQKKAIEEAREPKPRIKNRIAYMGDSKSKLWNR